MIGERAKIGLVVPANNPVIEPELWSKLPNDVAVYATRVGTPREVTREGIEEMEAHFDRAVHDLVHTRVDLLAYCDMVTSFVMPPHWSKQRISEVREKFGLPCITAASALIDALQVLGVKRFAMATAYPPELQAMGEPFFSEHGLTIADATTLAIRDSTEVPKIPEDQVIELISKLDRSNADAVLWLGTDTETFSCFKDLEEAVGTPVVTSNQAILWKALRRLGVADRIDGLGRLLQF